MKLIVEWWKGRAWAYVEDDARFADGQRDRNLNHKSKRLPSKILDYECDLSGVSDLPAWHMVFDLPEKREAGQ